MPCLGTVRAGMVRRLMRTIAIVNPAAAAGRVEREWPTFERLLGERFGVVDVRRTSRAGDGSVLARQALEAGAERIVALGGDGTVNEVVNGFFRNDDSRPVAPHAELAYLPAGTGGDLARTVGFRGAEQAGAVTDVSVRAIDVVRVELVGERGEPIVRHGLNISSFGASARAARAVNATTKALGGRVSFYVGTVKGLVQHRNSRVRIRVDDRFEEEALVNTVAVANGRYFGGGMKIAPGASPDDGLLDVVLVGDIGPSFFVQHAAKLYEGEHLELPEVRVVRGTELWATPLGGAEVPIEVDGEALGVLPARFRVLPRALRFLAPWDHAEGLTLAPSRGADGRRPVARQAARAATKPPQKRSPRTGRSPRPAGRTTRSPDA